MVMEPVQHVFMSFMDIFLDALPFMILGVLLSTIVENFIPEGVIQRMTPKHPLGGVLFACVLGIMFPLCECGMIPFVRRLMRKGMPVYIAVIFILVGPILNLSYSHPLGWLSAAIRRWPIREWGSPSVLRSLSASCSRDF